MKVICQASYTCGDWSLTPWRCSGVFERTRAAPGTQTPLMDEHVYEMHKEVQPRKGGGGGLEVLCRHRVDSATQTGGLGLSFL